jgi:hypothetical protein
LLHPVSDDPPHAARMQSEEAGDFAMGIGARRICRRNRRIAVRVLIGDVGQRGCGATSLGLGDIQFAGEYGVRLNLPQFNGHF